jgi:hypothetical protein
MKAPQSPLILFGMFAQVNFDFPNDGRAAAGLRLEQLTVSLAWLSDSRADISPLEIRTLPELGLELGKLTWGCIDLIITDGKTNATCLRHAWSTDSSGGATDRPVSGKRWNVRRILIETCKKLSVVDIGEPRGPEPGGVPRLRPVNKSLGATRR